MPRIKSQTEEVVQPKNIREMTTSELKEVIQENKFVYDKYKHYLAGDKVFVENIPMQKPIYIRLLDTWEAEGLIRRVQDLGVVRSYVPSQLGLITIRSLYKYNEAQWYIQEHRNYYEKQVSKEFTNTNLSLKGKIGSLKGIVSELDISDCPI